MVLACTPIFKSTADGRKGLRANRLKSDCFVTSLRADFRLISWDVALFLETLCIGTFNYIYDDCHVTVNALERVIGSLGLVQSACVFRRWIFYP